MQLRHSSLLAPLRVVSFLIILRAPISTLFPYTTLFRSCNYKKGHTLRKNLIVACKVGLQKGGQHKIGQEPQNNLNSSADRKSTRLNSSHVRTSYAVFCLKKKTIT